MILIQFFAILVSGVNLTKKVHRQYLGFLLFLFSLQIKTSAFQRGMTTLPKVHFPQIYNPFLIPIVCTPQTFPG
jgi:hypothetical protein